METYNYFMFAGGVNARAGVLLVLKTHGHTLQVILFSQPCPFNLYSSQTSASSMSFFQLLLTVLPLNDRRRFSIIAFVDVLLLTLAVVEAICDSVDFFMLTVESCSGDNRPGCFHQQIANTPGMLVIRRTKVVFTGIHAGHILSPDIFCGNKNLPPDKMSGTAKVLPDKTEFDLFQPDKCPMSGAISRIDKAFASDLILVYNRSISARVCKSNTDRLLMLCRLRKPFFLGYRVRMTRNTNRLHVNWLYRV